MIKTIESMSYKHNGMQLDINNRNLRMSQVYGNLTAQSEEPKSQWNLKQLESRLWWVKTKARILKQMQCFNIYSWKELKSII